MTHTHSILKTLGYARIAPSGYPHVATVLRPHSCVSFCHLLVKLTKQVE